MTTLQKIAIAACVTAVAASPFPSVAASEIWYGAIAERRSDGVYVTYKGPSGEQTFRCDDDGDCAKAQKPPLPAIGKATTYPASPEGTYGIKITLVGARAYYTLYDISGSKPKKIGVVPFRNTGATIKWSPDESTIVFMGPGSSVSSYHIPTQKLSTISISQTELPFQSISFKGGYLSTYNYTLKAHKFWNLKTGIERTLPGTAPSYLEFSSDEQWAAYAREVDGFKSLYASKAANLGQNEVVLTKKPGVIEDYLFQGNKLFYLANTAHPLSWDLYSYDPKTNKASKVETDVSYGDYLSRYQGKLAFIKIDGTTAHVNLHDPASSETVTLEGIRSGAAESSITRDRVYVGKRYGVLLSPKEKADGRLFVWLHGGPERQVALGYHPYLSYAVYDELIEKIAASGAHVLKLDYTGSTGYGTAFQKGLYLKIGDLDIKDVMNAVAQLKKEKGVKEVYLIGNSYGGYLALKGINDDPKTINGAISINGVTDWYGLISRIPSSPFKTLFEGVPDNHNMDAYMKASVFTNLDKLSSKNEVLVVYGTEDATVPTWQSTQYLQFAKEKKLPVEGLALEGEDHIIRKRGSLDTLCSTIKSVFEIKKLDCGL